MSVGAFCRHSLDSSSAIIKARDSNLSSPESLPNWLVELHEKLWGRIDLLNEIFHFVNLTRTDFLELQLRLEAKNPSRSFPSYVATDVSAVKMGFLRSRAMLNKPGARLAIFDTDSKLVPSVTHKPMDTAGLVNTTPTQTDPKGTEAAPGLIVTDGFQSQPGAHGH